LDFSSLLKTGGLSKVEGFLAFAARGTVMIKAACQIGVSACALWGWTLSAAPAQEMSRVAQVTPRTQAMPHNTPQTTGQQTAAAQPPPSAPQVPTRVEILNFDNWAVTCSEFADGPRTKRCSALLQILQQNTNQTVFTWTVGIDEHKQLMAVLQTPTGIVIPPGIELKIGKSTQKIPFASCEPGRCVATMTVDANLLREMTTVPTAEAVIQGIQGNTVQFNIQMKGFDRAYAALK
jgi:invasion protein IalB